MRAHGTDMEMIMRVGQNFGNSSRHVLRTIAQKLDECFVCFNRDGVGRQRIGIGLRDIGLGKRCQHMAGVAARGGSKLKRPDRRTIEIDRGGGGAFRHPVAKNSLVQTCNRQPFGGTRCSEYCADIIGVQSMFTNMF